MTFPKEFVGPNLAYILELYDRFQMNPASLDDRTRTFFSLWSPYEAVNGYSGNGRTAVSDAPNLQTVVSATAYAQAIRQYGHLAARLDPLGTAPIGDPELTPAYHGITDDDLRALPSGLIDSPLTADCGNLYEVCQKLHEVYSGSIPSGELRQVLYCATVYVATDAHDRPRPVDTWNPETPGDMALAERVRAHVNAVRTV